MRSFWIQHNGSNRAWQHTIGHGPVHTELDIGAKLCVQVVVVKVRESIEDVSRSKGSGDARFAWKSIEDHHGVSDQGPYNFTWVIGVREVMSGGTGAFFDGPYGPFCLWYVVARWWRHKSDGADVGTNFFKFIVCMNACDAKTFGSVFLEDHL